MARESGFQDLLQRALDRARSARPPNEDRVRFEFRRKILHVVTAILAVPVLLILPFALAIGIGALGVVVIATTWAIERRRLPPELKGPLHEEFAEVLEKTRRPHEDFPWSPVLYTLSVVVIATAHQYAGLSWAIAFAAYAILGIGDAASALVGVAYGRTKLPWNPAKSFEGTLAGFVAGVMAGAFLGALPYVFAQLPVPPAFLVMVTAGALAGALAETIPAVEDNLVVPLAAAGTMFGVAAMLALPLP